MTPTEQKAFDAMRGALEKSRSARTYSERIEAHECAVLALNVAASVSHANPETAPPPEGGAITAESAANAVSEQPKPVALQWVAEMIMSDCGCSTNNERLLERVIGRIEQYERANGPAHPQATEPAGYKLVPVEPTPEMLVALVCTGLRNTFYEEGRTRFMEEIAQGYGAMLAAAPEAKQ